MSPKDDKEHSSLQEASDDPINTSAESTLNKMSQGHAIDLLQLKPDERNESAAWKQEYAQRLLEAAMFTEDFDVRRKLYRTALRCEADAKRLNQINDDTAIPTGSSKKKVVKKTRSAPLMKDHPSNDVVLVVKKSQRQKKKSSSSSSKKKKEPITFVLDLTDDEHDKDKHIQLKTKEESKAESAGIKTNSCMETFTAVHTPKKFAACTEDASSVTDSLLVSKAENQEETSKDGVTTCGGPIAVVLDMREKEELCSSNKSQDEEQPPTAFSQFVDDMNFVGQCFAGAFGLDRGAGDACSCIDDNNSVNSFSCASWSCGSYSTVSTASNRSFTKEPITVVVKEGASVANPEKKLIWREVKDPDTGRMYYYHRVTRQTTWTQPLEEQVPSLVDEDLEEEEQEKQTETQQAAAEVEPQEDQRETTLTELKEDQVPSLFDLEDEEEKPAREEKPKREKKPAKPVWMSNMSEEQDRVYYYNRSTRQSTWTKPSDFDMLHAEYNRAVQLYRKSLIETEPQDEVREPQQEEAGSDSDDEEMPVRLLIKRGNRIEVLRIATITPADLLDDASLGDETTLTQMLAGEAAHEFHEEHEDDGQEALLVEDPSDKPRRSFGPKLLSSFRKFRSEKKVAGNRGLVLIVEEENERNTLVTHEEENTQEDVDVFEEQGTSDKKESSRASFFQSFRKLRHDKTTKPKEKKTSIVRLTTGPDVSTEVETSFEEWPTPVEGQETMLVVDEVCS